MMEYERGRFFINIDRNYKEIMIGASISLRAERVVFWLEMFVYTFTIGYYK